jgi:uncharacterized paraquat-inducible protein A
MTPENLNEKMPPKHDESLLNQCRCPNCGFRTVCPKGQSCSDMVCPHCRARLVPEGRPSYLK